MSTPTSIHMAMHMCKHVLRVYAQVTHSMYDTKRVDFGMSDNQLHMLMHDTHCRCV